MTDSTIALIEQLKSAAKNTRGIIGMVFIPRLFKEAATELTTLQERLEKAEAAIAWANNSLYGAHGFFLSTNGGAPDEHHLDRPIEELKRQANSSYHRAEKAEAENTRLNGDLKSAEARIKELEAKCDHYKSRLMDYR